MIRLTFILLSSLFLQTLNAQELARVVIKQDKTTGFINKKGELIIRGEYSNGRDFHDGVAAVVDKQTKKWGYINRKGEKVIDFRSEERRVGKECRSRWSTYQ